MLCKAMPSFSGFRALRLQLSAECPKGSKGSCMGFDNNGVGHVLRVNLPDDLNYMNEGSLYTSRVIAKSRGV